MARRLSSQQRRPDLSIELNHGNSYSEHSYLTGDIIGGKVLLRFHEDTVIESFSISFGGWCTSVVTSLRPWARESPSTTATHTFLMMEQPIECQTLPPNNLAEAGSLYPVPFCFTVPALLLPNACRHGLDQESPLLQAHRQLPPSLGRPESDDRVNDLACENARVEYNISACLKWKSSGDGSEQLVEKELPVRIIPTSEANPPLVTEQADPDYQLCAATDLCWGVLLPSSSDGHLNLHARQPLPLTFTTATGSDSSSASILRATHVTTNLEFHPDRLLGHPPHLESVKIRLRAFNYSAALPFTEPPRPSRHNEPDNLYNIRSKIIDLGTHCVDDLVWERSYDYERSATPGEDQLHTSNPGVCAVKSSSNTATSQTTSFTAPMHRTSLEIPIDVSRKPLVLVPTFDSCVIGRNYSLELTFSFRRSSSTPVSGSPGNSEDGSSPRSLVDHSNVVVTANSSRSGIRSRTKKVILNLPLQIIYDNSPSRDGSGSCASNYEVGSCPSRLCTTADHALPARLKLDLSSYTEKNAQTLHLENAWDESPPSYYSAFRSGQSVKRE